MLNEEIENCSEIADGEGLYFIWKNLISGVTSLESLAYLRLHHNGKINVDVEIAILLFAQLQIIEIKDDSISLKNGIPESSSNDKNFFLDWISKFLLQFLIVENVIELDEIAYDSQLDRYVLPRRNIKYRYACYRNLLLSLSILDRREDGNYYIEDFLTDIITKENISKAKLSEASLMKLLEQQRLQGEIGEKYIIEYEKKRLELKIDKSKIKRISVLDVSAGYDIISYNDIASATLNRFIEVKTYKGKPHFHWSANEINTAKVRSNHYFLYLVDFNKISLPLYEPIIICDPISYFELNTEWTSTPESFFFTKISD